MKTDYRLISLHLQAQNFARLAFHRHLKRAAAHFAIRREPLAGHAGVNRQFKRLAAKWTLNCFRGFHVRKLTASDKKSNGIEPEKIFSEQQIKFARAN